MTESATKVLVNALNDPEEPLSPEIEEGAVGVSGVLKNVLKSSVSQEIGSPQGSSSSSKVRTFKQVTLITSHLHETSLLLLL